MVRAGASPNQVGDKQGVLSTLAEYFHDVQTWGKRIKNWNYPVYYVGKKIGQAFWPDEAGVSKGVGEVV